MPTSHEATIRTAHRDDYSQVCRLSDALDELHRDSLPWMLKTPDVPARSEAFFADLLSREDSAVFVADATAVVGVAFGVLRAAPTLPVFIPQRSGVLDGLVVDPAWRRRGIGKRLAESVEQWALAAGAAWVELNVYDFNADARRFYESLGYLPLSTKLRKPR
jgi:GNAT superfamily N-acetyltransferase